MTQILPVLNVAHCEATGLRKWSLHSQSLQVCHMPDGNVILTFSESGTAPTLFELTPAQCAFFVGLLLKAPINTARPAIETIAQGVA